MIELRGYFKEYGHTRVPKNFVCLNNDYPLGIWVNGLRAREKKLTKGQIEQLEQLSFVWNVREDRWDQHFAALLKFLEEHGHTRVPFGKEYNDLPLGNWVASLRALKANLSAKRMEQLEQLGFV